jgi:hypothetical protein
MANIPDIVTGTDHELEIIVVDNDLPYDISDCTEIVVKVYQQADDILATYLLSLGEVYLIASNDGFCKVYISADVLTGIPSGRIFCQASFTKPDLSFESGFSTQKFTNAVFGNIIQSV